MSLTNDEIITHGPLCHCLSSFTVQLDPFTSLSLPPQIMLKKKKKSRTIHTSRQHAFLPVSDIIIANALVWRFQDDWCQAVLILSRKRWWPFVVLLQSSVGLGCLCILVVGLTLKTIQEHEGKPWSPSAPVGQTPAIFALGCQGLCKVKQGIKICLFSGYCVSFNRPGNSPW